MPETVHTTLVGLAETAILPAAVYIAWLALGPRGFSTAVELAIRLVEAVALPVALVVSSCILASEDVRGHLGI